MNYEELLNIAESKNIKIHDGYDLSGTRIKGLYCDGNIALSKDLHTEAEKKCVLAEYLDVTDAFLSDTITCYRAKYGSHARIDNYVIYFEPTIGVLELI